MDDARRVARKLDIPFYLVNVEQEFKENVVDLFYQEYVAGRTPNPCLTCNRHIRFTLLLNRALALDADYLATGHYVRVDDHPLTGKRRLRRGLDPGKDQSYVLHVLTSSNWHMPASLWGIYQAAGARHGRRARYERSQQGREPGNLLCRTK